MRRLSYNRNHYINQNNKPSEMFMGEPVGVGQYYTNRAEVIADFYSTNEKENLRNVGREHKSQLDKERTMFSQKLIEEYKKNTLILHDLENAIAIVDDRLDFWLDVASKYYDVSEENWFEKAKQNMEHMFSQNSVVEACIKAEAYSRAYDDMTSIAILIAGYDQNDTYEDEGIDLPKLVEEEVFEPVR